MPFDLAQVESALHGTPLEHRLHHLDTTTSTNTLALVAAQTGTPAGVWIADEQTAGRGRGGHTWHSAPGDGLYVSVLLRPNLVGAEALKLSLAAGLAAQAAVRQVTGITIDLRWPNDLMVYALDGLSERGRERKFGGILTETAIQGETGQLAYAVIGLGMNLNHASFPPDLEATATSLRLAGAGPGPVLREPLLAALLPTLCREIAQLEAEPGGTALLERFTLASSWVHGLPVQVAEDDGYTGTTDGLDPSGLLRIRLADGSIRTVRHGGVRRLEAV